MPGTSGPKALISNRTCGMEEIFLKQRSRQLATSVLTTNRHAPSRPALGPRPHFPSVPMMACLDPKRAHSSRDDIKGPRMISEKKWSLDSITDETYRTKFVALPKIIAEWTAEYGGLAGKEILDFGCGEATAALGMTLQYGPQASCRSRDSTGGVGSLPSPGSRPTAIAESSREPFASVCCAGIDAQS